MRKRITFMLKVIRYQSSLLPFLNASEGSAIHKITAARPEMLGTVVWPYQCRTWGAEARVGRILAHYRAIECLTVHLDFPVDRTLNLLDLCHVYEGFHLSINQSIQFIREGQLVLHLYVGETRLYSLAFSLVHEMENIVAYVGAIQGADGGGLLDVSREITKVMHGMRPRDFLFEIFRLFCRHVGVSKIYAVSDASRHHRHRYFGNKAESGELSLNYDEVWHERGGVVLDEDTFEFNVVPHVRNLEDVPSKKRSMYRHRYAFLDSIESQLLEAFSSLDKAHLNNEIVAKVAIDS